MAVISARAESRAARSGPSASTSRHALQPRAPAAASSSAGRHDASAGRPHSVCCDSTSTTCTRAVAGSVNQSAIRKTPSVSATTRQCRRNHTCQRFCIFLPDSNGTTSNGRPQHVNRSLPVVAKGQIASGSLEQAEAVGQRERQRLWSSSLLPTKKRQSVVDWKHAETRCAADDGWPGMLRWCVWWR